MNDLLANDLFLQILATVVGMLWAAFRASDWYARHKTDQRSAALDCIEAAVNQTYQDLVRKWKVESEDGKLTNDERNAALNSARDRLIGIGRQKGVDVFASLTRAEIDTEIEKAVQRLKGGVKK